MTKRRAKIKIDVFHLGTSIVKFNLPMELIDDINKAYDENSKNLKSHNDKLAGKIAEEKVVDEILTDEMKNFFRDFFQQYLNILGNWDTSFLNWVPVLQKAWINEMKSGEYNPLHMHTSPDAEVDYRLY